MSYKHEYLVTHVILFLYEYILDKYQLSYEDYKKIREIYDEKEKLEWSGFYALEKENIFLVIYLLALSPIIFIWNLAYMIFLKDDYWHRK